MLATILVYMVCQLDNFGKIRSGDMKAFEHLFMSLYPGMCNIANRYLNDEVQSKDIAQEAFIKLWGKRGELEDIISVKSYLYTTVRNLSLNYIRDNRKSMEIPGVLPDCIEPDLKSMIIEEETIRALYSAIDHLPTQSARIVRMTLLGAKNQEIAEQLGISVNSVKTLKYNALNTLRKELKGTAWLLFVWLYS